MFTNAKEGRVHSTLKKKMRKLTLESVKEFNSEELSVIWYRLLKLSQKVISLSPTLPKLTKFTQMAQKEEKTPHCLLR